ncbi:restriction endonuclease subunit S [Aliarcobacter butzleri]|uniref:restriction endonuclease subunit S n=1 Tax=Aliarcobacter butzleri TaxID=28197 RepID=UPI0019181506|nr:restriction endonuclease subunit S [Aliarcobacter butzleri]
MSKNINVPKLRFKEFSGEWEEKKLSDIAIFSRGKGISKSDIVKNGNVECIRYGELYTHYKEIVNNIYSKTNLDKKDLILSEYGDVIIPSSGETQIDIATASCILKDNVALGGDLNIIKTKDNGVFLSYYLNSKKKFDIAKLSQGISVVHLYSSQLKQLTINIPQKQEQEKIALFLASVGEKIEQLIKKDELLQQYKKSIIQKIFSQEIRFKTDNLNAFTEWKKEKLGKYLVEFKSKSIFENQYPVLTSSNKGLMLQSDYFGENRLTERENKGFNIVPNNYITYRSRSDNRIFTFNINTLGYTGIISTYYPVFESKNTDSRFIVTLLNNNKYFIGKYSVGTSQTVLSFNELKNIKMLIPCLEEQNKIANFLSSIDDKIEKNQKQLEKIKEFKKALLQQMFI